MNDTPPDVEARLQRLLQHGEEKAAGALSIILYDKTPTFIMNVRGRSAYNESRVAATAILKQELAKGNDYLYNRLRARLDSYWVGNV